jgi:hypothetical protein
VNAWTTVADKVARENARERVAGARARLTDLNRTYQAALAAARAHQDPNLSPEGLANRQRELTEQVHRQHRGQFEQLRAQINSDVDTLRRWADSARPQVGTTPADLQRAQVAWDRVRMRLEAGMTLPQVLATATQDEALAVREWAPTWLEVNAFVAHSKAGGPRAAFEAPDPAAVMRSADARLAEINGGEVVQAFTALREAEAVAAGAAPLLQHAEHVAKGVRSDPLTAAIQARYAAEAAGSTLEDVGEGGVAEDVS